MDTKPTINNFLIVILPAVLAVFVIFFVVMPKVKENRQKNTQVSVTNFEECVAAGNPVLESYPRQCRHGEQVFIENTEQVIGGQTDEQGCLTAAGYSWNEVRQLCTRSWEEPVMAEAESAVKIFLAEKYNKNPETLSVQVTKIDGTHVAGSIRFAPDVAGGQFLAFKQGQDWQVVYDGNGAVDCSELKNKYGFSALVLSPQFCD